MEGWSAGAKNCRNASLCQRRIKETVMKGAGRWVAPLSDVSFLSFSPMKKIHHRGRPRSSKLQSDCIWSQGISWSGGLVKRRAYPAKVILCAFITIGVKVQLTFMDSGIKFNRQIFLEDVFKKHLIPPCAGILHLNPLDYSIWAVSEKKTWSTELRALGYVFGTCWAENFDRLRRTYYIIFQAKFFTLKKIVELLKGCRKDRV